MNDGEKIIIEKYMKDMYSRGYSKGYNDAKNNVPFDADLARDFTPKK